MVIDKIDLVIKQPEIMSFQEKQFADSWANDKRNFSDSMVAASADNQLYSKSTQLCTLPLPVGLPLHA